MFDLSLPYIVSAAIALLLGLTIHEFAHAWVANLLGDPTPRRHGRVTLNPLAHLDPVGTVMIVLSMLGRAPIGWGKPVPINPWQMRWGRRGAALATAAGPLSNVLFALVILLLLRLAFALNQNGTEAALWNGWDPTPLNILLNTLVFFNVGFAAFNLIPIPPLDGFGIIEGLAPPSWERLLVPLRQYGMWILVGLVTVSWLIPELNLIRRIFGPLFEGIWDLLWLIAGPNR